MTRKVPARELQPGDVLAIRRGGVHTVATVSVSGNDGTTIVGLVSIAPSGRLFQTCWRGRGQNRVAVLR
jgi:hypothetical protein